MFVDEVDIHVTAGNGGKGCLSFRREKYVPRGGPDGGDGGGGGSVFIVATPTKNTLIDFRFHPEFEAKPGAHGQGANKTGHTSYDLEIAVPIGTLVFEKDADFVGFPNAGKSTLISRISAARPKIADYPFTTLSPNLGVVTLSDDRSFVVADVPGLIEGAHEGHGLGDKFLRHIERTKVLVHLVDVSGASSRDPLHDFDTILDELRLFDAKVAAKPMIVAATKMDAVDDPSRVDALERRVRDRGLPFFRISAVAGTGLDELLEAMWRQIAAVRAVPVPAA